MEKEIYKMLSEGYTMDEIAGILTDTLNDVNRRFTKEQEAQAKAEQEKKEKAAARDQAREALVDAAVKYIEASGTEINGDVKKFLTDYLIKSENNKISLFDGVKLFKYIW